MLELNPSNLSNARARGHYPQPAVDERARAPLAAHACMLPTEKVAAACCRYSLVEQGKAPQRHGVQGLCMPLDQLDDSGFLDWPVEEREGREVGKVAALQRII